MAYAGIKIDEHFCYDDENEIITGNWTFNGQPIYNALATFNTGVKVSGNSNLSGNITSTATHNFSGTQNISGASNITGNITSSGTNTFSGKNTFTQTVYGTAFESYYADIAEWYRFNIDFEENADYTISKNKGYLVEFSKKNGEVIRTKANSKHCCGIISSNPSFVMNDAKAHMPEYVPVALLGRVPCQVIGKLKKGDELTTSSIRGVAKKRTIIDKLLGKPVVGIALENKTYSTKYQIEVFIR